jgi:hypothetical protein
MPSYVPSTATDWAALMIKGMLFTNVRVAAADKIAKIMWQAAPWSWTVGNLSSVNLSAGTSDYTVTIPADFQTLTLAYTWDGNKKTDLMPMATLPASLPQTGMPRFVTKFATGLRISPKPTTLPSGVTTSIIALYKKTYTPITSGNIASAGALLMPDEWTWVFEEGILWQAYLYSDDDRAYKQREAFFQALGEMKKTENLLVEEPVTDLVKGRN